MRKSPVLLLAIGLIGVFSATAWWLVREGGDNAAIPEPPPAHADSSLADNSPPVNNPAAQPARPVAPAATTTAARLNPPAATSGGSQSRNEQDLAQMREGLQQEAVRRQNPTYRQAQDEDSRRYGERIRADAIRIARMSSEDVDRMAELGRNKQIAVRELIAASAGRPADDVLAEVRGLENDYQAQLREMLGDEKYERWQRYLDSQAQRNEANQFQRQVTQDGGEPLQIRQVDALVEALYAEEQRFNSEYAQYVRSTGISDPNAVPPRSNEWQLESGKARNKRIHDALAATWTSAQLASLDEMLAKKLVYVEDAIRYNESLAKQK
ncbi:MAG TPA: hypothetical protein VKB34_18135 [Povalibacter sp.]|nr:hypothetical protein [Povalibacter sp.]